MPRKQYTGAQKNYYSDGQPSHGQYPDNVKGDAEDKNFEAEKFIENKEFWKAISCLTEAISLNPNSPTYYVNRSRCFQKVNLWHRAFVDSRKSLELDETYTRFLRFVQGAVECNAIDSAIWYLEKTNIQLTRQIIGSLSTEVVGVNLLKKMKKLELKLQKTSEHKNFPRKLFYLEQCLGEIPDCVRYLVEKAETLIFLGKSEDAESVLNEAVKINDETGCTMYVRGLLYLYRDDDLDKALNNFESVILGELPTDELYRKVKFRYESTVALKQKKDKGNEAYMNRCYKEAYDIYSEALTVDHLNKKCNAQLYFNRGQALEKMKKKQEAIKELDSAIILQPNYVKALLRRADFYLDLENFDDAIYNYELGMAVDGNVNEKQVQETAKGLYYTALLKRAQICLKLNNYEQVIKDYKKVSNLDIGEYNKIQFEATFLKAIKNRADGYFDKGKLKSAINMYEQFFEIQVKEENEELLQSCKNAYVSAIIQRAKQSAINGDLKGAVFDYETVFNSIKSDRKDELQNFEEDYLKVLMQRAQDYVDEKLYRLAINEYERILMMNFSDYFIKLLNCETSYLMAILQLAQHYFHEADYERSIKTYEKLFENEVGLMHKEFVMEHENSFIEALKKRAECFLDIGSFEDAAKVFNKICKINNDATNKETFDMLVHAMKITRANSHYKVLDVSNTASLKDIKKAYHKLSLIHHPDRHTTASVGRKHAQNELFKIIQKAYDILSDPEKKAKYDKK